MTNFNPWHDVPIGEKAPEVVQCVIEIPKGERSKYELDKITGMVKLDRVLFSAVHYPANYGFIPRTYCEDGDPLDILVICSAAILPNTLVDARVIGIMSMVDDGEKDDKIIALAQNDRILRHIDDLSQLSEYKIAEIKMFFEDYKKMENKKVVVEGFHGKKEALAKIEESMKIYMEKFEFLRRRNS